MPNKKINDPCARADRFFRFFPRAVLTQLDT